MGLTAIRSIVAREVCSDRMKAAIQVTVTTENGAVGKAICSAGVSMGSHEQPFLYDEDARYRGKGVRKAVDNVNRLIAPRIVGMDATNQASCDAALLELDKAVVGGNAISSVSTAVLNAGAMALGIPLYEHIGGVRAFTLPVPAATAATGSTRYGGSIHAGYKPSYSFVACDFETFTEASAALWEVFMRWSDDMQQKLGIKMQPIAGMAIPQGKLRDDYQLWDMLGETIMSSGFAGKVGLQVDIAAGCFYNRNTGLYEGLFNSEPKTREDMISLAVRMAREHPFVILEDPLHDDDFEGFARITREVDIQITGDDLLASNPARFRRAIRERAGNALRVVTSQIGTVTEAAQVAQTAYENNFGIAPGGSRGEGDIICDYAVGYNAGTVGECGIGYSGNRLLQIEKELGSRACFLGRQGIKGTRFRHG